MSVGLLLLRTSALIAHEMARDKVVHVIVQRIVPLKLIHWDDVIDGCRVRVGPFELQVNEFPALVAYLTGSEYSLFCLLVANSLAPQ